MATVKLQVDGREVVVEKGTNLIEAGKNAGVFVPSFCYHPGLPVVGVCRICLCEIEGRPKLGRLRHAVEEGMKVITQSAKCARHARRSWSSCSSTTRSIARCATRAGSARCRTTR
jgi:NADH-quinone oxidoreductase subunit G